LHNSQEAERARLARELHDDLGQSLSLLKVQLSSIQQKLGSKQEAIIEKVDEARVYLDLILENVRRLSKALSPSILEDLGLSAALRWLIGDFTKHHAFKTDLNIENPDDYFTPETQIVIYRIFQEILANIGKHASADLVTVSIHKYEGRVSFAVADNGKGFDMADLSVKDATEKGIGLTTMQERALMLGSSLEIQTEKGTGTKVTFTIPIDEGIQKNG
jgi:signal transduction histidine kinase